MNIETTIEVGGSGQDDWVAKIKVDKAGDGNSANKTTIVLSHQGNQIGNNADHVYDEQIIIAVAGEWETEGFPSLLRKIADVLEPIYRMKS